MLNFEASLYIGLQEALFQRYNVKRPLPAVTKFQSALQTLDHNDGVHGREFLGSRLFMYLTTYKIAIKWQAELLSMVCTCCNVGL
jgi:hypothetical protein